MAERELLYRVGVIGQAEFARELKGIHDLVRKSQTEELALAKATVAGKKAARTDEQRHNSAVLRTQLALEKARAKESVREAERAAKAGAKATDAAEKEKSRIAQRGEKERQREAQKAARDSLRRQQEELRAFEKSEREKTRIAMREANARQREEERASREARRRAERDDFLQRRDRMFDHKRFYRGIGTGIVQGAGGAIRTAYGVVSGGARSIGGALGVSDAWDVGDIVQERMYAKRLMRSASIEARTAGGKFNGFDEEAGYAKVRKVAKHFGIGQRDLLGAIDAASEKGSGADAVKNLERIAEQATAMGTDATTVAKMRAQIKMSSQVAGKELGDDKIDKMMAMMHFVGKTGVFRAEDFAKESETLVSSFVKGGGDLETGWKRYMTFSNEARKSVGSGQMARTAIAGVQDAIAKKESKINALGIKTRDQDGERRDFIEVVMDVMQKTGAKGKAYTQIFDPAKSGKAIATMETAFNAAGGGKTGRAAMEKLLSGDDSLKDATVAEMQKDAAHRMDDAGTRIRKSVETFRQALSDKLAPAIERFAAEAPKIAEWLSKGIDWITKNPALAAGAVVGFGAVKGGAGAFAGAGLRFAGDTLANKVPGFGAAGGVMSSVGGLVTKAGSTPVYVTGAAPGAFGGGTGGPGGGDSGAGAAALAAAIGLAVGAAIGKVIKDTEEQKKKLLEEGEEWKRTHPNAGPGMKVKPGTGGLSEDDEYMRRRYGPGATNPDAEDPNSILSREALASPFADPTDYTKKHVDSAAANSPYASIEDYLWDKVGTGTFRFDENPNVNKSGTAMPVKAGDAGFGVLAPQPTGVPQATAAVAESEKLAKALAEVTRQLERFKNTQSAFK